MTMAILYYLSSQLDLEKHAQTSSTLRSIKENDALLVQQFLKARYYFDQNYDPLNDTLSNIRREVEAIDREKEILFKDNMTLKNIFQEYYKIFERRKIILEEFKASNAILKNSLFYLPGSILSVQNKIGRQPLLDILLRDVLLFNAAIDLEAEKRIKHNLQKLKRLRIGQIENSRDEIDILVRHVENILARKKGVDALINEIVLTDTKSLNNQLYFTQEKLFLAEQHKSAIYQLFLFAMAITLLFYIGLVIIKLKIASWHLTEANSNLKKFNIAADRFVPHRLLHFLGRQDISEVKLGDCRLEKMTVLFSDIRSFTSISEKMSPEDNFAFINSYLKEMGPIIRNHNGFIDKYVGDAIMALFDKKPQDALDAAISMHKELQLYNQKHRKGRNFIEIGIGLHEGNMMLGTIGEQSRMEGTVISDAVNLASRIESLTKVYKVSILISQDVYNNIDSDQYNIRLIDKVKVKGRIERIAIFEVFDMDDPETRQKKSKAEPLIKQFLELNSKKDHKQKMKLMEQLLEISPNDEVILLHNKSLNSG